MVIYIELNMLIVLYTTLNLLYKNDMHVCVNLSYKAFNHVECYVFLVPTPTINTLSLPSDPIQGAMVGSPQDIQCIVSTVSGVELSSVMISWMGPGGESITNDSRVTISSTTSSGNNYTSSLQFTFLMEGDEGMYTCNVIILGFSGSQSFDLIGLLGECIVYVTHLSFINAYMHYYTSYYIYFSSKFHQCDCNCSNYSDSGSITNTRS